MPRASTYVLYIKSLSELNSEVEKKVGIIAPIDILNFTISDHDMRSFKVVLTVVNINDRFNKENAF